MKTAKTPGDQLLLAEERIDWILSNPAMSDWLKSALRAARCRDPVATLNDLELLETLLQYRSQVLIDSLLRAAAFADTENLPSDASRNAS